MNRRMLAVGLAAPLALGLAACASSQTVNGQGGTGSTSSSSTGSSPNSSSSSTSNSPSSSSSTDPKVALAAKLGQGLKNAKTAHLSLNIDTAGHAITGSGVEKLSDGTLVATSITESVSPGVRLSLIIVGGKTFVKLPAQLNHTNKPWALVRAGSSNATVRALASGLASTRSSASLSTITAFVAAAKSVKQTGNTYAVDVDVTRLPESYPGRTALVAAGVDSVPISVTLDSQGRPLKLVENFTVDGQHVATKITLGKYNQPVHISAPPAKQVSTS